MTSGQAVCEAKLKMIAILDELISQNIFIDTGEDKEILQERINGAKTQYSEWRKSVISAKPGEFMGFFKAYIAEYGSRDTITRMLIEKYGLDWKSIPDSVKNDLGDIFEFLLKVCNIGDFGDFLLFLVELTLYF